MFTEDLAVGHDRTEGALFAVEGAGAGRGDPPLVGAVVDQQRDHGGAVGHRGQPIDPLGGLRPERVGITREQLHRQEGATGHRLGDHAHVLQRRRREPARGPVREGQDLWTLARDADGGRVEQAGREVRVHAPDQHAEVGRDTAESRADDAVGELACVLAQ